MVEEYKVINLRLLPFYLRSRFQNVEALARVSWRFPRRDLNGLNWLWRTHSSKWSECTYVIQRQEIKTLPKWIRWKCFQQNKSLLILAVELSSLRTFPRRPKEVNEIVWTLISEAALSTKLRIVNCICCATIFDSEQISKCYACRSEKYAHLFSKLLLFSGAPMSLL
jgi:hypothetical protein